MRSGSLFLLSFTFWDAEGREMATSLITDELSESRKTPREIEVPAPTAWPFVLAFGSILFFAALFTGFSVSVVGVVFSLAGCMGCFGGFSRGEKEVIPP